MAANYSLCYDHRQKGSLQCLDLNILLATDVGIVDIDMDDTVPDAYFYQIQCAVFQTDGDIAVDLRQNTRIRKPEFQGLYRKGVDGGVTVVVVDFDIVDIYVRYDAVDILY